MLTVGIGSFYVTAVTPRSLNFVLYLSYMGDMHTLPFSDVILVEAASFWVVFERICLEQASGESGEAHRPDKGSLSLLIRCRQIDSPSAKTNVDSASTASSVRVSKSRAGLLRHSQLAKDEL